MVINFLKKRLKNTSESEINDKYISNIIKSSFQIPSSEVKFLNPSTHKIEGMYDEEWTTMLCMCDNSYLCDQVANAIYSEYKDTICIIILCINEMYLYVRHSDDNEEIRNICAKTSYLSKSFVMMEILNDDLYKFIFNISESDLRWFDKARYNAFIRSIGNLDFVIED